MNRHHAYAATRISPPARFRCDLAASRGWHLLVAPLQNVTGMAVMLIVVGIAVKLALSVAATYRTRWWWLPGTVSTGFGALALSHGGRTETVGQAGVMLGLVAVLLARAARAGVTVR